MEDIYTVSCVCVYVYRFRNSIHYIKNITEEEVYFSMIQYMVVVVAVAVRDRFHGVYAAVYTTLRSFFSGTLKGNVVGRA